MFSRSTKNRCPLEPFFHSMRKDKSNRGRFDANKTNSSINIWLHIPPMDAVLFPGRLRPGKRSASIGRRLYIHFVLFFTFFMFSASEIPQLEYNFEREHQEDLFRPNRSQLSAKNFIRLLARLPH